MTQEINYYLSWVDDDNQLHTKILQPENGELLIGRSSHADILVINSSVSRQHVQLVWREEHLVVKDLNSSFGTWVNNVRLEANQSQVIYADTEIRLGNLSLWYELRSQQDEQYLLQTCFHPNKNIKEMELSTEISTLRAKLQQHLQEHCGRGERTDQLIETIDKDLFELNARQQERLKEQRILHSISHLLNRSLTITELLKNALDLISKVLTADRGFVVLFDADTQRFEPVASSNFNPPAWPVADLSSQNYSQTLVQRCYQQNKVLIIGDVQLNSSLDEVKSIQASGIRSVAIVPLQQNEKVVGVVYVDNINRTHCFDPRQIPFLETFAAHTSIALYNAQLYKRAITDDLTQLYTRKYIDERLEQEILRAQRYHRPFSILVLDLDHFKRINDNYGHNSGDQVLQVFSGILKEQLRDGDIAGRIGGEEFIIILGETDLEGAHIFAERIRLKTEQQLVEKDGQNISVTVSIGVANYQSKYGSQAIKLLEDADEALYQAKGSGRNRVVSIEK